MEEIGARLREARIRAKIDINRVEAQTKIRAKYLRAIENEEWDLLPGEVYVRSFLRTYADYLGLDSRELLDDFRRRYEHPADGDLRPLAPLGRERQPGRGGGRRRPRLPPWVAVVVVLVVVGVALYLVGGASKHDNSVSTSRTSTHAGHRSGTGRHRPATRKRPKHTVAKVVRLQLVPTGQLYVCLVNGVGHALIPGRTYAAGQTVPAQTAGKMLLTLGNNQVRMRANGVTIPVPASPTAIGIELLPGRHFPLPAAKQPQCG